MDAGVLWRFMGMRAFKKLGVLLGWVRVNRNDTFGDQHWGPIFLRNPILNPSRYWEIMLNLHLFSLDAFQV